MPFTLTMPKLSPTMEEGSIAKWHKKVGDKIEVGDLIMEVSTDKATVEFNAIDPGFLRKIVVPEGKEALVNQAVAVMTEEKGESIEGYQPEGIAAKAAPAAPAAETAAAATPSAEQAPVGAAAPVRTMAAPSFAPELPLQKVSFAPPSGVSEKRLLASPLARSLAKERGLDLSTVKGSGPNGRIMKRDLDKAQPLGKMGFGRRETPQYPAGAYELEPLTPMRKVIAQRLQEAKTFIPHFYVTQSINAEPLVVMRDQLREMDVKLTFNDFVVRACALALREHPHVNSGFDSTQNALIRFKTIDIAVAVSLEAGLITPIVRYADFKNMGELSAEIKALAQRAKEGKLEAHEYKGGSFTVSNLGMHGVDDFVAIINPPQAAIVAVSGIQEVPVVRNGVVVPGKTMNLTLSGDHRVIDGVAGALFLKTVKKYLENPAALLI